MYTFYLSALALMAIVPVEATPPVQTMGELSCVSSPVRAEQVCLREPADHVIQLADNKGKPKPLPRPAGPSGESIHKDHKGEIE